LQLEIACLTDNITKIMVSMSLVMINFFDSKRNRQGEQNPQRSETARRYISCRLFFEWIREDQAQQI